MNIGLLLSGGTGTRLGGEIPKQYIEVSGRPVIAWSLERLFRHEGIEAVQIVADPMWQEAVRRWIPAEHLEKKFMGFSLPGGHPPVRRGYRLCARPRCRPSHAY